MISPSERSAPYMGLRVLDLTQGIVGPMATMYLADFGADVVKIEPQAGDRLAADPGYLCWNRNKRFSSVDLEDYHELAELRRMLAVADVAVFDWPPSELDRLGFDATTLLSRHPSLIHLWLRPYSSGGRWSHLPEDPILLAAVSGVADYYRATEERPVAPVVPAVSYTHAGLAAAGVAAALVERVTDGRGRSLVVTGLHAVAAQHAAVTVDAPNIVRSGWQPKNGVALLPNYSPYQCSDGGWLFLGALTQAFFLSALEVLGLVEVMVMPGVDGDFQNLLRPDVAPPVTARLQERFRDMKRDMWLELLDTAGVPVAPVSDREEWFRSETVEANGMRLHVDDPSLGPVELPGLPVTLSATPGSVRHLPDTTGRAPLATYWGELDAEPSSAAPTQLLDDRPLPLEGLRVLDAATFIAGTFGPLILSHFGASVVKVEAPSGDPYRIFSASFAAINQAKRGLALDLKHPDGIATLQRLIERSDVLVENFRPASRKRLGLEWESLERLNPRLVKCEIAAYGAGPLGDKPGFDPLLQARSGLMAAQGGVDEPVTATMPVHDIGTGTLAAIGVLAALYELHRSGQGQRVTTSLANSSLMLQSGEFTSYAGRPAAMIGGRDWPGPSRWHRLYRCADGWIALAALTEHEIARVPRALAPHLERDRVDGDGDALAADLEDVFAQMSVQQALDRLASQRVPAASVLDRHDVFTDPWLISNNYYHAVDDRELGTCTCVSGFAEWAGSPTPPRSRSFACGEDTVDVLLQAGFAEDEIGALIASGAAQTAGGEADHTIPGRLE